MKIFLKSSHSKEFCKIPSGTFLLFEKQLFIPEFYLALNPISIFDFHLIFDIPLSPKYQESNGFLAKVTPYIGIRPFEAEKICSFLNFQTGLKKFRVPTENEWEYACRAGSTSPFYFGDEDHPAVEDLVNCESNYKLPWSFLAFTEERHPYGLRGMHGNVREICLSRYHKSPAKKGYCCRGGDYTSKKNMCYSASRLPCLDFGRKGKQGFRPLLENIDLLNTGNPSIL
jgi:formylglycine-generating enzyme required for sulfatase activity